MAVLPDYLAPGLKVVFCGTAVGEQSAARGHYFAGRGNDFWRLLDQTVGWCMTSRASPKSSPRTCQRQAKIDP